MTSAVHTAIMALSPAGYWPLDETSGTTIVDASGNGLNGTYQNGPTLGGAPIASGASGSCRFNAANSQYGLITTTAFQAVTDYTAFVVLQPSSNQGGILCHISSGSVPIVLALIDQYGNTGKIMGARFDSNWRVDTIKAPYQSPTKYTLAFTYVMSTGIGTIYLNGNVVSSVSGLTGITDVSSGTGLRIGRRWDNGAVTDHFNGQMSDVALWTSALSSAQISSLSSSVGTQISNVVKESLVENVPIYTVVQEGNPLERTTGQLWPRGSRY